MTANIQYIWGHDLKFHVPVEALTFLITSSPGKVYFAEYELRNFEKVYFAE